MNGFVMALHTHLSGAAPQIETEVRKECGVLTKSTLLILRRAKIRPCYTGKLGRPRIEPKYITLGLSPSPF